MDAIAALGAINSVVNYANSNNDDERQQKYTLDLMKEQNRYNKESAAQNQEYAKEMFQYTGAAAKVKQLKEAGLNPGLIYGMGTNASGSTTGAADIAATGLGTAPNVTGNRANKIAQTGMLLQLSKLQSEIDLNKSEAEANKAKASLENLQTNTEGLRQTGINLDNELKNIELNISNKSIDEKISMIRSAADKAVYEAKGEIGAMTSKLAQGSIDKATTDEQIKLVNLSIIKAYTEIASLKSGIKLNNEQIKELSARIQQNWIKSEYDTMKTSAETKKLWNEYFNQDMSESDKALNELIKKLIPNIVL